MLPMPHPRSARRLAPFPRSLMSKAVKVLRGGGGAAEGQATPAAEGSVEAAVEVRPEADAVAEAGGAVEAQGTK